MHLSFLADYWWAVLSLMAAIVLTYVFVAGRGAEGGLGARASLGWSKWKALSTKVGEFQARVILTLFYFTFAAPFGLWMTHLADPLRLKKANQPGAWLLRETRDRTLDDARRQF